jgi:hypothetical protein
MKKIGIASILTLITLLILVSVFAPKGTEYEKWEKEMVQSGQLKK